jgi:hypothetical protein
VEGGGVSARGCPRPGTQVYFINYRNFRFVDTSNPYLSYFVEVKPMDLNKPEPAPKGTGREITPLVIKDLTLRSAMGKEKYGETLRAFNGRNALVDAYQEALDLVQYLRQMLEEQDRSDMRQTAREFIGRQRVTLMEEQLIESPKPVYTPRALQTESVAQEAHRLVLGSRGEAYGHPIFDMTRSADMLTALLRNKLRPGVRLEAEDIGQAMICVKQSRHRNKPKRDNNTDTAGYALTLEMIAEWRVSHPGVDPRDVFPEV